MILHQNIIASIIINEHNVRIQILLRINLILFKIL